MNTQRSEKDILSTGTRIGFLVLTVLGACLSWTSIDAKHVVGHGESKATIVKRSPWKTKIINHRAIYDSAKQEKDTV